MSFTGQRVTERLPKLISFGDMLGGVEGTWMGRISSILNISDIGNALTSQRVFLRGI